MDSLIGLTFGPFVVVEKLGEGPLGAVYKGFQRGLDRYIAIKTFGSSLSQDPEYLAQLRQQVLCAAKLSHPNILHIYTAGVAHGVCFIVMDLALGGSLKDWIQGLPMDTEFAISVARQLAGALEYAHEEGVAHGDIRSENVLMTRDGRPVLADFGVATALAATGRGGVACGDLEVDQVLGSSHIRPMWPDPALDIQALGAVLFEMLAGYPPVHREGAGVDVRANPSLAQPAAMLDRAGVPHWLAGVVDRALSSSGPSGYRRARDLARDLELGQSPMARQPRTRRSVGGLRLLVRSRAVAVMLAGISAVSIALVIAIVLMTNGLDGVVQRASSEPQTEGPGALEPAPSRTTDRATAGLHMATTRSVPPPGTTLASDTATVAVRVRVLRATGTLAPTEAYVLPEETATTLSSPSPSEEEVAALATGSAMPGPTEMAGGFDGEPSLEGRIAFPVYDEQMQGYRVCIISLSDGVVRIVADFAHQPAFRPDGLRLAVDGLGGGRNDLWSLNLDGSGWQQMTRHPDDQFPTWSPDGGAVAFSSTRQGDGVYRLYFHDDLIRTSVTHQITGDYPVMLPNWEVVFSGCNYGWGDGSKCGLWSVEDGLMPQQLTGVPQDIPNDGTAHEVLFLRTTEGNWDVYRVAVDGGEAVRLTTRAGRDGPAAFSPDGQSIAFLSEDGGEWALYVMTLTGTEMSQQVRLPAGGNLDSGPSPWFRERISWGP